jgi:hypothetical protein
MAGIHKPGKNFPGLGADGSVLTLKRNEWNIHEIVFEKI